MTNRESGRDTPYCVVYNKVADNIEIRMARQISVPTGITYTEDLEEFNILIEHLLTILWCYAIVQKCRKLKSSQTCAI